MKEPIFKNISPLPQELRDGDDRFIGLVLPGARVTGQKFRQFAFPGSPIIELRDQSAKPEPPIRIDLIDRYIVEICNGSEVDWQALRPAERVALERILRDDVWEFQRVGDLRKARRVRAELRRAHSEGWLTIEEPQTVAQVLRIKTAKPADCIDEDLLDG